MCTMFAWGALQLISALLLYQNVPQIILYPKWSRIYCRKRLPSAALLLVVHNSVFLGMAGTIYLSCSLFSGWRTFSFHCTNAPHMLFAWQLWGMDLPDLQEAGHSRATASAVFGDLSGVSACEYWQLPLCTYLRCLPVAGAGFPILWASLFSALDSVGWKWCCQGRELFGNTENTKITFRVCLTWVRCAVFFNYFII